MKKQIKSHKISTYDDLNPTQYNVKLTYSHANTKKLQEVKIPRCYSSTQFNPIFNIPPTLKSRPWQKISATARAREIAFHAISEQVEEIYTPIGQMY